MTHIRRYRILYRVPPQHLGPDTPYEPRAMTYRGHEPIPVSEWAAREAVLEAFDAQEAVRRLEYRLVRDGYGLRGAPGVPMYSVDDIVPVTDA